MNEVKITIEQLRVGHFVRLPLAWYAHPFLLSSFMIKNEEQLDTIKKLNIKYVFIYPQKSTQLTQPINHISAQLDESYTLQEMMAVKTKRIEEMQRSKHIQKQVENKFQTSLEKIKNLDNKLQKLPLHAIKDVNEVVDYIYNQINNNEHFSLHLMPEALVSERLYYHSLNVATLSMLLAKKCGKNASELRLIGVASIFHDIGKTKLPSHLMRKLEPLTLPEQNLLKLHPEYGVRLISSISEFPKEINEIKEIIYKHHERLDGTGYPDGTRDMNDLTQILSVTDEFDYLCSPSIASIKPVSPYSSLSFLYKNCSRKLNLNYIHLLIKQLGIYPPGCVVELNNGQIGLVMSINTKNLLYPKLMIYDQDTPKDKAAIINLETLGEKISRVILPARLPREIFDYLQPRKCISYFIDALE